jgi:trk system potassium uptake protein TrkA
LKRLELPEGVMVGLIHREKEISPSTNRNMTEDDAQLIFPHGDDHIFPFDEVTLIGETDAILGIHRFFGVVQRPVNSIVIIGGSLTAWNLARMLGHLHIDARIIEKDYERCVRLAELLPQTTIIHHDAADYEFLLSEKVAETDMVVTCTENDEVNLLTAMLAKEAGCSEAIVMLSNMSYLSIVDNLGLKHIVSPRISAANHIMSQMLFGKVTSLISLYNNRAEIMEINVSQESNIAGIPLSELGPLLPKNFLVAMIQNRGRIMVARGDRVISPGDTVIAISDPKHIEELEKNF